VSILVSVNNISHAFSARALFEELSFGIFERQKVGLLGPNGSGKSTLLKILEGVETPSSGSVSTKKGVRIHRVEQNSHFSKEESVHDFLLRNLESIDPLEAFSKTQIWLGIGGFEDTNASVKTLSGGWSKRLQLCLALASDSELILLDEPTNHMDWEGILWFETQMARFGGSFVLVSHDRSVLNNLCSKMVELNPAFENGILSFDGNYDRYLEQRERYLSEQGKLEDKMTNKAKRELEWLRAGVKARTTKSQSRSNEAFELLNNLDELKSRNRLATRKIQLDVQDTKRQSRKLIELKDVDVGYGEKPLIEKINITFGPRTCVGILGFNGSGKTSLIKVITGELQPMRGSVFRAESLKILSIDQKRESLPLGSTIWNFLADGSDHVVFRDKSVHVASYASRFLFESDKLQRKIESLSGGERARLALAKQLLMPADAIVLDEPTNDLDIESIEMLEEQLSLFEGLLILISHDRYFLSRMCNTFLGIDGHGAWNTFAETNQWVKQLQKTSRRPSELTKKSGLASNSSTELVSELKAKENFSKASLTGVDLPSKTMRTSYKDKRFLETVESEIEIAERELALAQKDLENADILADHEKMQKVLDKIGVLQNKVDALYERWSSLEKT